MLARPATIPLGASIDSATPPNGLATATQIARATGRIIEKPRYNCFFFKEFNKHK